jgi:hypothetical protein
MADVQRRPALSAVAPVAPQALQGEAVPYDAADDLVLVRAGGQLEHRVQAGGSRRSAVTSRSRRR